jgi:hypothetical protein
MNDDLFDVTPEQSMFIGGDGNEPPEGSREWFLLSRDRLKSALNDLRWRHDHARKLFDTMRDSDAWKLLNHPKLKQPFASFDKFCLVHFNQSAAALDQEITTAQVMAGPVEDGGVAPLAKHGTNQHTGGGANGTSSHGSNQASTIVAKLKRDHPEFAERLAAGEYRSARAAGIAAGIIVPDAPLTLLRRAWKLASADERDTFREEIENT